VFHCWERSHTVTFVLLSYISFVCFQYNHVYVLHLLSHWPNHWVQYLHEMTGMYCRLTSVCLNVYIYIYIYIAYNIMLHLSIETRNTICRN